MRLHRYPPSAPESPAPRPGTKEASEARVESLLVSDVHAAVLGPDDVERIGAELRPPAHRLTRTGDAIGKPEPRGGERLPRARRQLGLRSTTVTWQPNSAAKVRAGRPQAAADVEDAAGRVARRPGARAAPWRPSHRCGTGRPGPDRRWSARRGPCPPRPAPSGSRARDRRAPSSRSSPRARSLVVHACGEGIVAPGSAQCMAAGMPPSMTTHLSRDRLGPAEGDALAQRCPACSRSDPAPPESRARWATSAGIRCAMRAAFDQPGGNTVDRHVWGQVRPPRQRVTMDQPGLARRVGDAATGPGYRPPTEAMFTIRPPPCARRCGAHALASEYGTTKIGFQDPVPEYRRSGRRGR